MTRPPLSIPATVFLFLLCLAHCGYRPVGRGEISTSGDRPTLAIPLFDNRSTEIGLEALFANTFTETFSRCRALRLAARPENADLVLEGKISSVAFSSVAYYNISRSLVRRVTIRVEVQLTRRSTGKVVWKDQDIVQEDYVVAQTYQEGEALRDMGIRRGAATLAKKMLDKVLLVI
ncbi:MAG: LPS assembly lipoprotein LptE [Desulfobaccales bacterium]